jgi:phosphoribosylglycinamide formyltransferase-1
VVNNGIPLKNLVIFASGSGSNAEKIFEYFKDSTEVLITHIFSKIQKLVLFRGQKDWLFLAPFSLELNIKMGPY